MYSANISIICELLISNAWWRRRRGARGKRISPLSSTWSTFEILHAHKNFLIEKLLFACHTVQFVLQWKSEHQKYQSHSPQIKYADWAFVCARERERGGVALLPEPPNWAYEKFMANFVELFTRLAQKAWNVLFYLCKILLLHRMINFTALIGFHLIYGYINSNGHKFKFRWYPSQTNKARSIVRFVDWIYTIEISGKLSIVMRKQMNFNRTNFHSFGYATWFEWFEWFFFLLLSAKTHFAPCIHHIHTHQHSHTLYGHQFAATVSAVVVTDHLHS